MKKVLVAVVASFPLAALVSCTTATKGIGIVNEKPKKEIVVLVVWMHGNKCKLDDKTPGEIRTDSGSKVTWKIQGTCKLEDKKFTISIDRKLKKGLKDDHELFTGSEPIETEPLDGNEMSAVLMTITPEMKGNYGYRVKIDGQDAEHNSKADRGTLRACPDWPCG